MATMMTMADDDDGHVHGHHGDKDARRQGQWAPYGASGSRRSEQGAMGFPTIPA